MVTTLIEKYVSDKQAGLTGNPALAGLNDPDGTPIPGMFNYSLLRTEGFDNIEVGTTYTFVISDGHSHVTFVSTTAVVATVPPNSAVAFPIGTIIPIKQFGDGRLTIAEGAGVTIISAGGALAFRAKYSNGYLQKTNTDAWSLYGDLDFGFGSLSAADIDTSAKLLAIVGDEEGSGLLVFNDSPDLITPNLGTPSAGVLDNCTGAVNGLSPDGAASEIISFIIDGRGNQITTGIKGDLQISFACTIIASVLLADQTGDIVVDIWKDGYATFPPLVDDSIVAAAKPTISAGIKSSDVTLIGWTIDIDVGDILRFNVDSVTAIERLTINLDVVKD